MANWDSFLENYLLPGEQLITYVADLRHSFFFAKNSTPDENFAPRKEMVLALTNYRLIGRFWNGSVWKWFYTSAIHNLVERKISREKPKWPYQAVLSLDNGLCLVVQTWTVDKEQQKKLSNMLVQAFMKFGIRGENGASNLAISAYDEEERQRRQQTATITNRV